MKKENDINAKDNADDGKSALHIGMSCLQYSFFFVVIFSY
jgi:hypothetical protein